MIHVGTNIQIDAQTQIHIQMGICYSGTRILAVSINCFVYLNIRTWLLYQFKKIWLKVDTFVQIYAYLEWGFENFYGGRKHTSRIEDVA